MKAPIAAVRSLTELKVPRRMAWRVMMPKKISTMLSQEQLVRVKCRVIRGLSFSQAWRWSLARPGLAAGPCCRSPCG